MTIPLLEQPTHQFSLTEGPMLAEVVDKVCLLSPAIYFVSFYGI